MKSPLRAIGILLCMILFAQIVGVCSYASRPSSEGDGPPRTVILKNENWQTTTVYIVCENSLPQRVSQLNTFETREVEIRREGCDELTLRIELSPSGAVLWAPPTTINPGGCLRFVIQNNFGTSAWAACLVA